MKTRRIMRSAVAAGAAAALVAGMGTAQAARRDTSSVSFFETAGAAAHWAAQDGNQGILFEVGGTGWAGASLNHHDGAVLAGITDAPSFVFTSSASGQTGGAPRITVVLSNGGVLDVRTDQPVVAGTPTTVTSDTDNVDTRGGACGYRYDQSWAAAVACSGGAAIAGVYLIDDSGWLLGEHTSFVDDLQFGGTTISGARDNAR